MQHAFIIWFGNQSSNLYATKWVFVIHDITTSALSQEFSAV